MKIPIAIIIPLLMVCFLSCSSKEKQPVDKISIVDTDDSLSNDSVYSIVNNERLDIDTYPNFDIEYAFRYEKLQFLVGRYIKNPVNLTENDYGIRLLVLDSNNKLVFRSIGAGDSYNMSSPMYKLDNNSPVFILSETGDESGSWGNVVFMIQDNIVKSIGKIDLGVPKRDEEDPYSSVYFENIGDYTRIIKNGKTTKFIFDVDTVCFAPGRKNEKILNGRNISYVYDDNGFRLIEK